LPCSIDPALGVSPYIYRMRHFADVMLFAKSSAGAPPV
jgi:hypothetical protein